MSAADLGGKELDATLPRPPEASEAFHDDWERHFYGLWFALVAYSRITGDKRFLRPGPGVRWGMEQTDPSLYLRQGYYERFLYPIERAAIRNGVTSEAELTGRRTESFEPPSSRPSGTLPDAPDGERMAHIMRQNMRPPEQPGVPPRFKVGDTVRAVGTGKPGHTRLPDYARGKTGTISAIRGTFNQNDHFAMSGEALPEPVYSVAFSAATLWGDEAEASDEVLIDMWEAYLTPEAEFAEQT